MVIETELTRRSREQMEKQVESRESKEGEVDEELKTAAALERADYLVREVKSSKQQMQNIILHMQQVLTALQQLRAQLQLSIQSTDATSITQDKKRIEKLKEKIKLYKEELPKMKDDLIAEQVESLKQSGKAGASDEALRREAEEMVEKIIKEIEFF